MSSSKAEYIKGHLVKDPVTGQMHVQGNLSALDVLNKISRDQHFLELLKRNKNRPPLDE